MKSKISVFIFLLTSILIYPQVDYKIISSDRNSITVEYTPLYTDTTQIKIDNDYYHKVLIFGGNYYDLENWGEPAIPIRALNIGVPGETGNTIQVLNTSFKKIVGRIIPKPRLEKTNGLNEEVFQINENYYSYNEETELVTFGEFGLVRGLPVQSINVSPVIYNPGSGELILYTKILFRIDFSSSQPNTQGPFDDFTADVVLNYNVAKNWVVKPSLQKITANSVLATGNWVKFQAPEEGIYKITYPMLQSFGIDPSVDPRTIKIYNNGGKMLPEQVTFPSPTDLVENAISIVGENDGVFNESDYIIFYGRGNNFWDYDTSLQKISRHFHLYSNENYYWITSGGNYGKRMTGKESSLEPPVFVTETTPAFISFEEEKINLPRSGRYFYGDEFNELSKSKTYMNKLDGLVSGSEIVYNFRFINSDENNRILSVEENGTNIFSSSIKGTSSVGLNKAYQTGVATSPPPISFTSILPEDRSVLKFTFNASGVVSKGYLDYFEINYQRKLIPVNDQLIFFSPNINGVVEYNLNNFSNSNIKLFDITDFSDVKLIINHPPVSGSGITFRSFESQLASKYFALGNDQYKAPVNPVQVQNSDLHGLSSGAKFIVITHSAFRQQAERLKQHKENNGVLSMSTVVAEVDAIYNEFSGGLRDVTAIRNFIKYAFENWEIKPDHVLLFGDGDYDFKNIEGYGKNFIPSFQIAYPPQFFDRNLNLVQTYNTDDYFVRVSADDLKVDLACGRLNTTSPLEAENVVDKIIHYELGSEKGIWRNNITLVADDGWTSTTYEGAEHTAPSESLFTTFIPKSFDVSKIYMAAYPAEITGSGKRKPAVTQDIIKKVNEGTLILNYIGHGSPEVWAHEVVLEKSQTIPRFNNENYFFLTAATCDFGYFDNPANQSGGEELILKPNSGAIAVYTASRAVYSVLNHQLIYNLYDRLLNTPRDTFELPITIGKAILLTKENFFSINDQKYHILGDPTIRLIMPRYEARIDSINGQPSSVTAQIKALGRTTIAGEVKREDGTLWSDYNGEALLTVYDSERQVRLQEINYPVIYQGGVIFNGRVSVTGGRFSADFVVPKDISYENKNGKVVLYFYDQNTDGLAFTNNIIVGGTDTTAVNDGKGPDIDIYFNSAASANYLVNPDALLIVKLSDETGLNTTGSGIGHMLEGIINDDENAPIDLSNHFTGDLDAGGRSGEINYRFNDLQEGEYKIQIKAWDVFNNYSTENSYFTVASGNDLVVRDVYNYPNPFAGNTTFTFQQNLTSPIDLKIRIYTVAGRMIREIEKFGHTGGFVTVDWDGTDNDGNTVSNGTYLYKIVINSIDGQFKKSVLGKLAVVR